jgi:hypothetical protein
MNRTIGIVAAYLVAVLSIETSGQQSSMPVTERLIDRDLTVRSVGPCTAPSMAGFIARVVGVPAGVEYVPGPCGWDTPEESRSLAEPVLLQGKTVAEALDALIALDPRYRWSMIDDVIVVRPMTAWGNARHFLHQTVDAFAFENRNLSGMLHEIQVAAGRLLGPAAAFDIPGRTPESDRKFSVRSGSTSIIGMLDAVARAHGRMSWEIEYCDVDVKQENALLSLWAGDKGGHIRSSLAPGKPSQGDLDCHNRAP